MNPTRIDGGKDTAPAAVPITMTPLYKILSDHLKPQIEGRILERYVERSGRSLPSKFRLEDLTAKAAKAMKTAIEQAYDLKLPANLVVPNVLQTVNELLEAELNAEFGADAERSPSLC